MIEAVMLWNEPNNRSHWNRELDPDWRLFADMVSLAGDRIHGVAPGLTRVLGGLAPMDPGFLANMMGQGVGQAVDVVAVHGFPLDWNRWHIEEWPERLGRMREVAGGKPVWATEVGVSSFVSEDLQAWGLDRTAELVLSHVDRAYWYALMDLPDRWEATTRHRGSEGSAYYRHFRMGVYDAEGCAKPAASRLRTWAAAGLGVCEWVYWQEPARLRRVVSRLRQLAVRRLRTGIGWADWVRPGALEWFDFVMGELRDFDLTLTLCFTPAELGLEPHHTSPPRELSAFADFCEQVVERYAAPCLPAKAMPEPELTCAS
ncbi:MAG: beta-xylosidase [Chloroflexi bacterium]|nr:beta-xylosidase [Chloroflexota bacterium]